MYCIIDKNAVLLSKTLEDGQTVVLRSCVARGDNLVYTAWCGWGEG
jgi:hypothetical protein